jgi:ATP-dependent Clp protease, protease subunit
MKTDFENYAVKHLGIGSLTLDYWQKQQDQLQNSVTPNIVEERKLNVALLSVFDRLMVDRIIWCAGPVDERMAIVVQAQLMYLDSLDKNKDIVLHLDTPGGSVLSGLSIIDVMDYVSSDIVTINTGMCASMGSVLLSSGTKGKRSSLIYSKVMTHMVSHGSRGNIQETRINQMEAEKYNYLLFKRLAENCGTSFEEIYELSRNDKWFNSDEAVKFGLIDEVIGVKKGNTITDKLKGFDQYYKKEVLNSK